MEPVAKAVVEAPTVDTFKRRYDSLKKGRHKAYGFYARQPISLQVMSFCNFISLPGWHLVF